MYNQQLVCILSPFVSSLSITGTSSELSPHKRISFTVNSRDQNLLAAGPPVKYVGTDDMCENQCDLLCFFEKIWVFSLKIKTEDNEPSPDYLELVHKVMELQR